MTSKDALSIGTDVMPPVLFKGEYEQWKDRFLDFVDRHTNGKNILLFITEGPMVLPTMKIPNEESSDSEDGNVDRAQRTKTVPKEPSQYTKEEKKDDVGFEGWQPDESSELHQQLRRNKVKKKEIENNVKFLSILQPEWKKHTRIMKQIKDLSDISLHKVYETLRQNEEEVEEKRSEKKKIVEKVVDPITLVVGQKEKEKKEKKMKMKRVLPISDDSEDSDSDSDDGENLKQAMLLLTRAFEKKFYKKSGSNSKRYSSGSKNHEHRERVEGRKFEEKRFGERKPEEKKNYVNDYGSEKKTEEMVKCYNCGKLGHYAKDCRKPTVRNSDYYKQKMLLAKQNKEGKALMAEDEFWLDHSEDETKETIHMCLMGDTVKYDDSEEETTNEVENKSLEKKMEAKLIKDKIYTPPLVLEIKIMDLENALSDERILVDIEQNVFSTVMKNTIFKAESLTCSNSSKAPQTSEVDFDDLFASANDFLNSDDGCVEECIDRFDFNSKLPDHSAFIINSEVLPSVYDVGESSTKVGEPVSMSTNFYQKCKKQRKRRSQKRNNTGRPKKRQSKKSDFPNKSKSCVSDLEKKGRKKELNGEQNGRLMRLQNHFLMLITRHMWYLNYGCSKHMTGQKDLLSNYTEKFCGNVRFDNDQFSPILGYGDVINDNVTITKVRYVEDLEHNLFSIGQFCDKDLEVNFKAKRCSVRTEEASLQQSWLWHRRLSHLNFRYINKLVTGKLVKRLPELKYEKEHLCAACEKGKMKRAAHKTNPEPITSSPLEQLHMGLCGPMHTQSINGKKYVLVIVDDYSRYTWVKFLRLEDETPEVIIGFLKITQVNLQNPVKLLRTNNDTECFILNDRESLNKFGSKADEGIFIGYSQTSVAYRVYLKKSKTVIESVNVTFDEDLASKQSSSELILTGVLASGQISP
ncbi:hypothetical protein L6452_06204 [Arctium lappa]|uniref:Uncharacterized protein n=1 Tax=Arctium lappa TaxID=4217 RepID=A0ACB9EJK2_ARCLA|nr:hypothetical protein L6452_06204 [Arctium lappa]